MILSLGFPISEVKKSNLTLSAISEATFAESYKKEAYEVVFSLKEDIKQNYDKFLATIVNTNSHIAKESSTNGYATIQELIKMIQELDLANHTPMQTLVFVQELKIYINPRVFHAGKSLD